jgi:hypothetical protein
LQFRAVKQNINCEWNIFYKGDRAVLKMYKKIDYIKVFDTKKGIAIEYKENITKDLINDLNDKLNKEQLYPCRIVGVL